MATEAQILTAIESWSSARQNLNALRLERQTSQTARDNAVQRLADLQPLIATAQLSVDTAQTALKALL